MAMRTIATFLLALAAAGCATQPQVGLRDETGNPVLERMTPGQWSSVAPQAPVRLGRQSITDLSQRGVAPEAIIDRYYQTGSRLQATPAELAEMRRQGVSQQVLDYIASSEQDAKRIDAATAQAERDGREREQWLRTCCWGWNGWYGTGWWGPRVYPYGGYAWFPGGSGWYGGLGFGF
jgi:hypothetical protein